MKATPLIALTIASVLAAGQLHAAPRKVTDAESPRALAVEGPVQVQWGDPQQFSEIRRSHNRFESERGNWVEELAAHVRKSATRQLPAGQTMDVTFTDIKRAGDFEPWNGPRLSDVRMMRDIYPPRITLSFVLRDAAGNVVDEGQRKLTDMNYLQSNLLANNQDPLRYEKRILDEWVRKELKADRATAGL